MGLDDLLNQLDARNFSAEMAQQRRILLEKVATTVRRYAFRFLWKSIQKKKLLLLLLLLFYKAKIMMESGSIRTDKSMRKHFYCSGRRSNSTHKLE